MLDIFVSTETEKKLRSVEKNKTMLIIGKDTNRHAVNVIKYYDSLPKVLHDYGDSELSKGFEDAKKFSAPHVFLLNVINEHDYIDLVTVLKQYDFAYIVPLNIYISDYFHDKNRNEQKIHYGRDYIERASAYNNSLFIMTDKHASLYEDMDHFLDEMKAHVRAIRSTITMGVKAKNFAFVANNLRGYSMSNVVLASILTASDYGDYPAMKREQVIFDIDSFDIGDDEIIYFKQSELVGTTVENLVNFEKNAPILKSIFVDRIINYILRTLDLSDVAGRNYSVYQKIRAEKMLELYFDELKGWLLRDYQIESIEFIKESVGAGVLECTITVWPKSTTEKYALLIGG